ncbi:MAG: CBS domain-containing protein [Planctomycetota bacterium]|jgi:CBS domain-containing membrane protein
MADDGLIVRNIMAKDVQTITPETPAARAARTMINLQIKHLVVTDGDGQVVGIVSQRDVMTYLVSLVGAGDSRGRTANDAGGSEVRSVMAEQPITITADTPIRKAAAILASNKIGCLPVVVGRKRLIGLVTAVDVLEFVGRNQLPEPEEEFRVFMPLALLSEDHELQLPVTYFPGAAKEREILAVLAYATRSKRMGVKLLPGGQENSSISGARPTTVSDGHISIQVGDFVEHYGLGIHGSLEVAEDPGTGYLVLSPVAPA